MGAKENNHGAETKINAEGKGIPKDGCPHDFWFVLHKLIHRYQDAKADSEKDRCVPEIEHRWIVEQQKRKTKKAQTGDCQPEVKNDPRMTIHHLPHCGRIVCSSCHGSRMHRINVLKKRRTEDALVVQTNQRGQMIDAKRVYTKA